MDQLFGKKSKKPGASVPESKDGLPEDESISGEDYILSYKEETSFFGEDQTFDVPPPTGPAEEGGSLYSDFWNEPEPSVSGRTSSRRPGVVKSGGSSAASGEREEGGRGGPGGAAHAKGGGPAAEGPDSDQDKRGGKNSSPAKGSCPSWLKSRLYKGNSSPDDDKRVLELQEHIIRHSPVGTAVMDNRGQVRIGNSAFKQSIGLDAEDSVKDIDQVGARIRGVDLVGRFWDAVESGTDTKIEEQVEIRDKGQVTFRAIFRPVTFPSGMSWCICYVDEVSSPAPTRGRLWEYQNYVACVATSSGDAIVGLDLNGIITYWNQGAQALFGYTDDEIVGKPGVELVPDELRREAQLVLKVVLEKGIYKNYDTYRLAKNGQRVPVTMTVAAVRNDDGEIIGTAATLKDVRTTKDLHEKAMEAEKLNAVLQMAVTVYHQINDPLCVIAANAQLLLTRIQAPEGDEAKKLESILEATKRITTVIEDLGRLTGVEPQILSPRTRK